ncbi:hypothetical protein ACOMHN_040468 [Nucella lapillus]
MIGLKSTTQKKDRALSAVLLSVFVVCLCSTTQASPTPTPPAAGCGELKGEEVCCGGRKYHRDFDRVCCSLRGYPEGEAAYVWESKCAKNFTDDPFETCGSSSKFDIRYEGCCGTQPFNRQRNKCCPGSRKSTVVGLETACCYGQGLKPGEMCCQADVDMVIINKTNPAHTNCCVPRDYTDIQREKHLIQTYDKSTHYCHHEGRVELKLRPSVAENRTADPVPSCLRGQRQKEEGEQLECCDLTPYRPSRQTCCAGVLSDLPSSTSVCCYDQAYDKHDDDNNPCVGPCGGHPLNSQNQICCMKKVFNTTSSRDYCCGPSPINPNTHECCGGMPVDRSRWACCQDTMPYKPMVMHCNNKTGDVTLRQRQLKKDSIPHKFCDYRNLDTWDKSWRSLIDTNMIKLQGRVDSCGIRLKGDTLTIPLIPAVAVVGGQRVSSCLKGKELKLVITLPNRCARKGKRYVKKLKRFLKGNTLEVMVKVGKLQCKRRRRPVIVLKEREAALVLRSRRMDRLLEDASLSAMSGV